MGLSFGGSLTPRGGPDAAGTPDPTGGLAGHLSSANGSAPVVTNTLVLANNTWITGNFLAANGRGPCAVAYDSGKGEIFVAENLSNSVAVVSAATNRVVGTILGISAPRGLAYDSTKGEIFVKGTGIGGIGGTTNVSVVSDSTLKILANVSVPNNSSFTDLYFENGMAYDSGKGEVFVANEYSGTVSVISDTSNTIVATIAVGSYPMALAYDSGKGEVFLTNDGPSNVTVLSDTTNSVVATITLGGTFNGIARGSLAYDSSKGEVFVASPPNVSVISDQTNSVIATVPSPDGSVGVAYDGVKGEVFATGPSDNVTVISDTSNKVVTKVPLPPSSFPYAIAYDSGSGELFVTNVGRSIYFGSNFDRFTMSVVSDATNLVVATVQLGSAPEGMAYDSGKGEIFIVNLGASFSPSGSTNGSVLAISVLTGAIVATIPVGTYPGGIAFDSRTGQLFVANGGSGTVSVISDSTNSIVTTIPIPGFPFEVVYDGGRGQIFVSNQGGGYPGLVSVISDITDTVVATVSVGSWPSGLAYDSARSEVFVANYYTNNVSVISDATDKLVATIPVGDGPQDLAYDSGKGELFVANTGSYDDNLTVISDATNAVVASVPLGSGYLANPHGVAYDGATGEIVVTKISAANVSFVSDSSDAVIGSVKVGADPEWAMYDPGTGAVYVTNFRQGTLSTISWSDVYSVTFTESGLPSRAAWSVQVAGQDPVYSVSSSATLVLPNGSYSFAITVSDHRYQPSLPRGTLTVSGRPVIQPVTFWLLTYTVSFVEYGLPTGTGWAVSVNGSTVTGTQSTLTIPLPNGTYSYALLGVSGFLLSSSSPSRALGNFSIVGAVPTSIFLFVPFVWNLSILETGLPSGTQWEVAIGFLTVLSLTTALTFSLANGSYNFTVMPIPGYNATPGAGSLVVLGAPSPVHIAFTATPVKAKGSGQNSTSQLPYYVALGGLSAAVTLGVLVGIRHRRARDSAKPEPPRTPPLL